MDRKYQRTNDVSGKFKKISTNKTFFLADMRSKSISLSNSSLSLMSYAVKILLRSTNLFRFGMLREWVIAHKIMLLIYFPLWKFFLQVIDKFYRLIGMYSDFRDIELERTPLFIIIHCKKFNKSYMQILKAQTVYQRRKLLNAFRIWLTIDPRLTSIKILWRSWNNFLKGLWGKERRSKEMILKKSWHRKM